ncbi:hypothetical protein O0L34_g432 [Tuta absoluta]|nr:hypothetical protein O0L34_g432 [Tuta absoluta]
MTSILHRLAPRHSNKTIARASLDIRAGVVLSMISLDNWRIAVLFSAYFIGYCVCFPLFHNWGDRLGPTWVVGIAGMASGTLSCLTPAAAYFEFWILFTVRLFNGFCAAAMLPSMIQLTRHWVPPIERLHFMWAYCGVTTGTFTTFLFCAAVQYYSKWIYGFYFTGIVQIVWALVWLTVITDYPSKHPFITRVEKEYLERTIGTIFTIKLTNSEAPWWSILRSVPFWALCFLNFGYAWMIMSLCIHGPLYYFAVVEYNIYSAAALTALPFLMRLIIGTVIIQVFHWYKYNASNKDRLRLMRKYFIVVSHVVPGVIVASTWTTTVVPGPILLTIAVSLTAAGMDLTLDLCYELSPTFTNSLTTVIKIIGNIPGIIVPLTVGEVTHRYRNSSYVWKHIWCCHAAMLLISGVVFLLWGETKVQSWNYQRKRPPHAARMRPKPSKMSNIIELDEDDALKSQGGSKTSSLFKPFSFLQRNTDSH